MLSATPNQIERLIAVGEEMHEHLQSFVDDLDEQPGADDALRNELTGALGRFDSIRLEIEGQPPTANAYALTFRATDPDAQLAEAIRERDDETAEAVIEPEAGEARNGLKLIGPYGDPIINAMRRMQIGKPCIQGIEHDIRRARELSRVIGDAGPDVSAWLSELADKLERAA